MAKKVFYVEDEPGLQEIIKKYLTIEGYAIEIFGSGEEALKHIDEQPDLWILDIMLGGKLTGYDIIKELHQHGNTEPVIFLSARDQQLDKITGLEYGAADYISKPFSPKELILRVNNVLNRSSSKIQHIHIFSGYEIDNQKREVKDSNKELIKLTTKEYDLLLFFLKNKNAIVTRNDILVEVWGKNYSGSDRVVDDLLRRLRTKLPNIRIDTIYGLGYKI
jgi:two-component system response regulator CssR